MMPVSRRKVDVNELVSLDPVATPTSVTDIADFASNDLARSIAAGYGSDAVERRTTA